MTLSFGSAGVLDRVASTVVPSYSVEHVWGEGITVDGRVFVPLIRYRTVSFAPQFSSGAVQTGGGYTSVEPVGFLTTRDGEPRWIGFLSERAVEKGLRDMLDSEREPSENREKERR